jgi:predicted ATPase/DNA-binding CsgD family transcriptional regulator/DNA-binding XRE family transcriptional regulator
VGEQATAPAAHPPGADFGARLRRLREAAGLTQEALAERAGLSPNAIGALERGGRRHPHPGTVHALAQALGLSQEERAALLAAAPRRLGMAFAPPADAAAGGAAPPAAPPGEGSPAGVPPPATPAFPPLPASPTPLVGREHEVAAAVALLREGARLVTLVGPGGVGKTRLALAVAATSEARPDLTPVFVDLAPLAEPTLLVSAVARAVGAHETPGMSLLQAVVSAIGARPLLLVLDNFEHLLASPSRDSRHSAAPDAAPAVAELLAGCPRLVVVVTSREPLRLRWEHVFVVPPLPLVAGSADESDPRAAPAPPAPAVSLFVQRARAADAAFTLTEQNAGDVLEICRLLDGLPLALELAAARVRLLPPAALLARLRGRAHALEARERDRPARHQTLRATIAWSYDLLSPQEQAAFRRLGAFAGGCTPEAAGSVCGMAEPDLIEGLEALVDKSLLERTDPVTQEGPGPEPGDPPELRFRMLETVRSYARETLEAAGEGPAVRGAHARYHLALAEDVAAGQTVHWERLGRLARHQDDLRAALRWALEAGDAATGGRLAGALWVFWFTRGALSEGRRWLEEALALQPETAHAARANLLLGSACLHYRQGELAGAAEAAAQAVRAAQAGGEDDLTAASTVIGGMALLEQGVWEEAARQLASGRELARGRPRWEGIALWGLGRLAVRSGDPAAGVAVLEAALALQQAAGERWAAGVTLYHLGQAHAQRGNAAAARARLAEAARLFLANGDRLGAIRALDALAWAELQAAALSNSTPRAARRGVELLSAAAAARGAHGMRLYPQEQERHVAALGAGRRLLDPTRFGQAWAAGATLELEEAAALAGSGESSTAGRLSGQRTFGLSERERAVAGLIAAGLTSKAIARRLTITEATADAHAMHIRTKLGVRSRAEIAAWAVRNALEDPSAPRPGAPS